MFMMMADKGVNKWQQSRAGSSDTMCYKWDHDDEDHANDDDDHENDDDDHNYDDNDHEDDDDHHGTFDLFGWMSFYREFKGQI